MIISINEMFNLPDGTVFRTKSGTIGEIVTEGDDISYVITGMDTSFDLEWVELPAEILYLPLVPRPDDGV